MSDFQNEFDKKINDIRQKNDNLKINDLEKGNIYAMIDRYDPKKGKSRLFSLYDFTPLETRDFRKPAKEDCRVLASTQTNYGLSLIFPPTGEEEYYLFFAEYLGEGKFRDIQSGAKIIPNSFRFYDKQEYSLGVYDQLSEVIKEYQIFYNEDYLPSIININAGISANELKYLYGKYIYGNKELCDQRKEAISQIKEEGLNAPQFDINKSDPEMANRIKTINDVDNFLFEQYNKSNKPKVKKLKKNL